MVCACQADQVSRVSPNGAGICSRDSRSSPVTRVFAPDCQDPWPVSCASARMVMSAMRCAKFWMVVASLCGACVFTCA